MTGEMSYADPDEWPLHYEVAKAIRGKVKPFDVYQGPYIYARGVKVWINWSNECEVKAFVELGNHSQETSNVLWCLDTGDMLIEEVRKAIRALRRKRINACKQL